MIKKTPLEYTQDEFNAFVEKHNYEVFSAETVNAFCKDLLEKSEKNEIDEFEKSCAAADFASLTPAIIVGNDLVKRTVYYRENQTEEVEIPDGIFKSINDKMCRKFKETSLNILKGIAGINCADEDAIEKAKALPIGTEKTYGGKLYVKTEKGWRPKVKGTKDGDEKKVDGSNTNIQRVFNELKNSDFIGEKNWLYDPTIFTDRETGEESIRLTKQHWAKDGNDFRKVDDKEMKENVRKLKEKYGDRFDIENKNPHSLWIKSKKNKDTSAKKNKFAREIEEARKIGEQLRKEHEQRVASGQKIGSDDPRDQSKLIGFNKK